MNDLRSEEGFGLIELLISMVMLNVGILAIVAAFNSGAIALRNASEVSAASVLGDKQMELYRALQYTQIALDATALGTANSDTTSLESLKLNSCTTSELCFPSQTPTQTRSSPSYRLLLTIREPMRKTPR